MTTIIIALSIWIIGIILLTYLRGRYDWNVFFHDWWLCDRDVVTILIFTWPLSPILIASVLLVGFICLSLKTLEDKGKHHRDLNSADKKYLNEEIKEIPTKIS